MKVFAVSPTSRDALEVEAELILQEFDPEMLIKAKPLDIERLVDTYMKRKYDWSLYIQDELPPNIEGYCDPKEKLVVLPALTYAGLSSDGRARFTATHEFCHVVKHRDQMTQRMITFDEKSEHLYRHHQSEVKPYVNPEWQANYLAGALLMPFRQATKIFQKNGYNAEATAQEFMSVFKVSYQAARVRIDYLKKKLFKEQSMSF